MLFGPKKATSQLLVGHHIVDKTLEAKKIYRLKEDQAFSLSLELGRREKFARHPSADFLLHSVGGGGDFVDLLLLLFKGKVSRDRIFIKFCEVTSMHSCAH
jgi:hypothetical protein